MTCHGVLILNALNLLNEEMKYEFEKYRSNGLFINWMSNVCVQAKVSRNKGILQNFHLLI